MQLELDRGDDGEAPAAAAQGPEEVGLVVGVDHRDPAVGRDDLDGENAVGRKAVLATQPAEPAAERVADHADIVRRPGQCGQAMLGGGDDDLGPLCPGLDAGIATVGIDLHDTHAVGPDQDRVLQRGQHACRMPGALRGHAKAPVAGEVHHGHDVGHRLGLGDGGRLLVYGEVPGLTRAVQSLSPGTLTAPVSYSRSARTSSAVEVVLYILKPP
jgi:hypothetical protein